MTKNLSLFERSTETLTGKSPVKGLDYYLHDDLQGTEPSVDFLSPPPPSKVCIYRTNQKAATNEEDMLALLKQLGMEARTILDKSLPETGVVLLRGIPVDNAHDFSNFWQFCCQPPQEPQGEAWKEAEYVNMGRPRQKEGGVDAATNIPSHLTLNPHNELSYNPVGMAPSRIGLYCIQPSPSGGGESLMARNEDITKQVPPALISHLDQHGGIIYERAYRDASRDHDTNNKSSSSLGSKDASIQKQLAISWQEKCGLPPGHQGRAEAEQYWVDRGFSRELLMWEDDGTLRVRNIETGFITPGDNLSNNNNDDDVAVEGRLWFNNIDTVGECADGSGRPPNELVRQYQADRWKATYAWRLEKGDWLVLDNKRVQHGRLPYPTGDERRLLTVLTA